MLRVFYDTAQYAVVHAAHSLAYALPTMVLFFGGAWLVSADRQLHFSIDIVFVVLILLTNALFIIALTRKMVAPDQAATYWQAMRWRKLHTNFFIFTFFLFVLLGALFLYFYSTAVQLLEFAADLGRQQGEKPPENSPQYGAGANLDILLIAGSRFIIVLFLVVALLLWLAFYRLCIKIPAHVAGYYISSEEVKSLTRESRLKILFVSLTVNGGLSGVAAWLTPDGQMGGVQFALIATFIYWLGMHVNVSLWTALYDHFTAEYFMRREIE